MIIAFLGGSMGTTRKTITVTEQQDRWIKAQIAAGDFTNDSEYIRDLIRRDQEQNAKFRALKAAVNEGLASGATERTVREIWDEAEQRFKANGG
jgi:antitoxin ParD1/3/4